MSKVQVPAEKAEAWERLIETHPEVERKGKNLLYTSVNGHMFTMFSTEAMFGIRLSDEDQAAFLAEFESGPFLSYGSTMRGYVTVPDDLLFDTERLAPWLARSYAYVSSLPPKPTKKPKK